jgi:hypothetical protein
VPTPAARTAPAPAKTANAASNDAKTENSVLQKMTPQERMERLARASRMQTVRTSMPKVAPNGWSVPKEEVGAVSGSNDRSELVTPPQD